MCTSSFDVNIRQADGAGAGGATGGGAPGRALLRSNLTYILRIYAFLLHMGHAWPNIRKRVPLIYVDAS